MTKSRLYKTYLIIMILLMPLTGYAYAPKAEKVVENVYAIVGPLGQRSKKNDGLNNNMGFIVTKDGVILIDSGASYIGAKKLAGAIRKITDIPVKWVINTGGQDHRWLGNQYFSSKGAKIIALKRTVETQSLYAKQQLASLKKILGERLKGTVAQPASVKLDDNKTITLGGVRLILHYTNAHYPGDSWIWMPEKKVVFTGDLVFTDRLLAVLPWSSVRNSQQSFHAMEKLNPQYIIPGHGHVCDLKTARKDTGNYYDFLVNVIGKAALDMESMDDIINKYTNAPDFRHLKNFKVLHRKNMSRTFLEFEQI